LTHLKQIAIDTYLRAAIMQGVEILPIPKNRGLISFLFLDFILSYYYTLFPRITCRIIEITAITRSICIRPPAAYPKKPIAQITTRITAMMYNILPMIILFLE